MPAWQKKGRFALAFISGAIGVVATLRSFVETSTGTKFEANQFPFYLGTGSVVIYISLFAGLIIGFGPIALLAEKVKIDEDKWMYPGFAVAAVVAIATFIVISQAGVAFDYEDTDTFGRICFAILGIFVVGGGLWYAFKRPRDV